MKMTKKEEKKLKQEILQEQSKLGIPPKKKHTGLKIVLSIFLGICVLFTLSFCSLINFLTVDTEDVNLNYKVNGNVLTDGDYEIEIKDYKVYDKNNPNNTDGEGQKPIIVFFYEVRNISDDEAIYDATQLWIQDMIPIQDNKSDTVNELTNNDSDEYYSGDFSFEKNPEESIKKGGSARGIFWYALDDSVTPVELRYWLDENVKMTFEIKNKLK